METSNTKEIHRHENNLQIINGLPFSLMFKKETVHEALNFKSHEDDVILATYPKTGTTWVQYIVFQILSKGDFFPPVNDLFDTLSPSMEARGVSAIEAIETSPRFYKTHLPLHITNLHPGSKIIYVYRKAEDNFVSLYHYMTSAIGNLDFEQFFEDYIRGNVSHGLYFEHILSYVKHMGERNILMVSYEKLHAHTKEEILRIAEFLGQDFYQGIVDDDSVLNKIIKHTSFEFMQKNLALYRPENPIKYNFSNEGPQKKIDFFRKGKVGDGKTQLREDQLKRLKSLAEEKLKGTEIIKEWYMA